MSALPDEVRRFLAARSRDPEPLGSGMEGEVLGLDPSRVAKVWSARGVEEVRRLQAFTGALAARDPGFAVPAVLEVHEVAGRTVTIERRLRGEPLDRVLAAGAVDERGAQDVVLEVLAALASAGPLDAARLLPVLDETEPLVGSGRFGDRLAGLVERRVDAGGAVLRGAVDRFEAKAAALLALLPAVDAGARAVLHGDLVPQNVLVDPQGRLSAVLDWGFLTTEGDPAFDAATASALFDMYGPRALDRELALLDLAERCLGHDRRALLVHRAAYSAATATVYSSDGSDGHFAWCVAALNRPDVVAALLG